MIDSNKLTELSKAYLIAKEQYEKAVRINIRTAPPMKDKSLFWEMLHDLGNYVQRSIMRRDDPVRHGIEEWLRETWVKGAENYSIEDFPSFVRTYSKLKESLAKKLTNLSHLGDGFSDLVDSLPLAGKQPCLRLMAGEATDTEKVLEIVRWGNSEESLVQLIVNKENHVEQWLEQAYADALCKILTFDDGDFALELENADP
jgi:hypothetical protein